MRTLFTTWVPLSDIVVRKSTFPGHEGVPPALIEYPAYTELADADTSYNSHKDGVSIHVPSYQTHRYTPVGMTPDFTASSTLTEVSKKKRTQAAVSSLRPARRPAGMREASTGTRKRSYSCDICGKKYSQPQGVSRHRQAEHSPHSCLYCVFKWSRPYQYRAHLEKWHLDVNPDNVLGKPAGSRRKSTIIGRNLLKHPAMEPDLQGQTESPPAVANITHVSRPAMLSVAYYDPGLERAEPAVTTHKREDASVLELPDASGAPSAFSFTEVRVQSVTDVGISSQRGQLWLAHPF